MKDIDVSMAEEHLDYEELNKLFSRKTLLSGELDSAMEWWISIS
jgi:ATP-binding cassette, subfamily F, member 3